MFVVVVQTALLRHHLAIAFRLMQQVGVLVQDVYGVFGHVNGSCWRLLGRLRPAGIKHPSLIHTHSGLGFAVGHIDSPAVTYWSTCRRTSLHMQPIVIFPIDAC